MKYLSSVIKKSRQLRKQGLSFYEISRILNVSNSTIRNWCFDLKIDRHKALIINNKFRREKLKQMDLYSIPNLSGLTEDQTRFLVALLYGCEGAKYPATNIVSFVNSDPNLIRVFIMLFRKSFDLDEKKFRVHLQIHQYHNIATLINYWSKLLNVPIEKFLKPTITSPRGKMRRQNYLGTCSLRYIDNKIQLRLLGIFENFCSQGGVA